MANTVSGRAPGNDRVRHDDRYGEDEALYDQGGRTAWGAIFAGAVIALAVFQLLSFLGVGIGAAAVAPETGTPMNGVVTGSAIWVIVSQLIALVAGGFTAGRLAGKLHRIGAILHGVAVWALATIVTLWLAASAVTGAFSVAGQALTSAVQGSANAVEAAIPDNLSVPDAITSNLSFNDLPDPVQQKLRNNGITPQNFQSETREAMRAVISEQEQQRARQQVRQTAMEIIRNPGNAGQSVEELQNQMFGGENAVISEEDRQEAMGVMQARFGLSQQEAQQMIDTVQQRAEEAQQTVTQQVQQAAEQAREAADVAANNLSKAGFGAFIASLVGLLAAAGGAFLGTPGSRSTRSRA